MSDEYVPPVNAFSEASALWHLMQERPEESRRVIDAMLYEEKSEFASSLRMLHRMVAESIIGRLPSSGEVEGP